ncbi:hypothetical protein ACIQUU_22025 [Streptomyces sp. NPDC101116]|uniref:hypothetical protein n=1 Tax=Streptomyces sp. NPDC101116 TaxID=3366107 RepID=UPI00382F3D68
MDAAAIAGDRVRDSGEQGPAADDHLRRANPEFGRRADALEEDAYTAEDICTPERAEERGAFGLI